MTIRQKSLWLARLCFIVLGLTAMNAAFNLFAGNWLSFVVNCVCCAVLWWAIVLNYRIARQFDDTSR